ncbi:MAG: hypothetical protein AB1445_14090 [Bacillota bacterium]
MDLARQTFGHFKEDLWAILGPNLYEILIHGSYVLGNFAPHRGDLDYVILTHTDLSDQDIEELFVLHDAYRAQEELLLYQLEGTTYPKHVLAHPGLSFTGCYIGTGRQGWQKLSTFQNSLMDLKVMSACGLRLLGTAAVVYSPGEPELLQEQWRAVGSFKTRSTKPNTGKPAFGMRWSTGAPGPSTTMNTENPHPRPGPAAGAGSTWIQWYFPTCSLLPKVQDIPTGRHRRRTSSGTWAPGFSALRNNAWLEPAMAKGHALPAGATGFGPPAAMGCTGRPAQGNR